MGEDYRCSNVCCHGLFYFLIIGFFKVVLNLYFIITGNFTLRTIYNVRHPSQILINPDLEECHLFMSRYLLCPYVLYHSLIVVLLIIVYWQVFWQSCDDVVDSNPTWYSDSSMELIENDILNSAHVKNLSALEKLSTDVSFSLIKNSFYVCYVLWLTNLLFNFSGQVLCNSWSDS